MKKFIFLMLLVGGFSAQAAGDKAADKMWFPQEEEEKEDGSNGQPSSIDRATEEREINVCKQTEKSLNEIVDNIHKLVEQNKPLPKRIRLKDHDIERIISFDLKNALEFREKLPEEIELIFDSLDVIDNKMHEIIDAAPKNFKIVKEEFFNNDLNIEYFLKGCQYITGAKKVELPLTADLNLFFEDKNFKTFWKNNAATLTHLNLRKNTMSPSHIRALSPILKDCVALIKLNAECVSLGDRGVKILSESWPKNLQTLSLDTNCINVNGMRDLIPTLINLKDLEYFSMNDNALGNEGLKMLGSAFARMNALKNLEIRDNDIDTVGVKSLIDNLPKNLTKLDLSKNKIDNEGKELLQKKCKEKNIDLKI